MTSTFEGQPPKTMSFSNQNKGHLGSRYMYIQIYSIYLYICIYLNVNINIQPSL